MEFVHPDQGLPFPGASVANTHSADGMLLATGWLVNWPGAGFVYLSDGDLIDVLAPAAKERPAVQAALVEMGWTEPGKTNDHVAALEAKVADLEQQLEHAMGSAMGFDEAIKKLEAHVAAVEAAKHKPAAKSGTKSKTKAS